MGSENSALKRDELEEPPFTLPSGVTIYPALLQRGKPASVFVYEPENEDNVNKAAKHLKTLRHPCLLRFLACSVEADGIHLVTERVQPLEKVLETLSSSEICLGIYDVLQALVFLHERGKLTHNNVSLSSVFVSEDGHWKLGGMETVCKQSEATAEFLRSIESIREKTSIPPEEQSADFQILPEGHGHTRDAYSFGVMVENLLPFLNEEEQVIASFQHTLRSGLLNPDLMCRSPLSRLLSHDFFRNDFLEVVSFLNSLTLKTEEEKTEFFKFLLDRVSGLSEELIALRLVPLLLNQLVFAEPVAVKSFLPHLLGPKKDKVSESQTNGLLSPAIFQAHVSPALLKLFEVHEEHVRLVLLSHIDAYAELFTQKELKNVILPQVLLGLRDTSDCVVAGTLQSLGVLVSLLGPDVVIGGDRTKIFKRSAPSFSKTTDVSPQDSPTHIISCQRKLIYEVPQRNSSVFFNGAGSGRLFSSRSHLPRQEPHFAPGKGEQDYLHISHVSGGLQALKNGPSCQDALEKVEEWPDWSECEEREAEKRVTLDVGRKEGEPRNACLGNHDTDEDSWDDVAHSPASKLSPEHSTTSVGLGDISELPPNIFELKKEFRTLRGHTLPEPGHDRDCVHPRERLEEISSLPRASFLDKPPKLEGGLGEEFMIQVKRRELYDAELDWFADMVPDIKPPSALLILPEPGHHLVPQSSLGIVSNHAREPQNVQLSSKFAATESTEADVVGWEDENDLNWEEDGSW